MDFDATAAYCKDLSLDLEDVVFFALAELTHAPKMGYFDRKPWIDGWKRVRKDSIDTQKAHIQSIKRQLSEDPEYYKQVYGFCFAYAKEESQKSLCGLPVHGRRLGLMPFQPSIWRQRYGLDCYRLLRRACLQVIPPFILKTPNNSKRISERGSIFYGQKRMGDQ